MSTKYDSFTLAYLGGALWASTDGDGDPLDKNFSLNDLAPEVYAKAKEDCEKFQKENANLLEETYETPGYNCKDAGRDFFLTRNHHGAGFWDRGLGEVGDKLTEAAHAAGSFDLYVGDDGQIYGL